MGQSAVPEGWKVHPGVVDETPVTEVEFLEQRIADLIVERGRLFREVDRLTSLLTASQLKVQLLIEGIDADSTS